MLLLHQVFSRYDSLCTQYGIYKVETIGDCWMGATGLLADDPLHASRIVAFGRDMLAAAASVDSPLGGPVRIRVGVHSGRVMSGIIGSMRARYCLFGDTVNTASRMESTGVPGRVQVGMKAALCIKNGRPMLMALWRAKETLLPNTGLTDVHGFHSILCSSTIHTAATQPDRCL